MVVIFSCSFDKQILTELQKKMTDNYMQYNYLGTSQNRIFFRQCVLFSVLVQI